MDIRLVMASSTAWVRSLGVMSKSPIIV
jgi:hypothetical protein